ncbi:PHA/PHB synthase family protein [Rhodovibrionaceae bacterium A322]
MGEQHIPNANFPDPAELSESWAEIAEKSQKLITDFMERQASEQVNVAEYDPDPLNISTAFLELTSRMMADPDKLIKAQTNLWESYMELWQSSTARFLDAYAPTGNADAADPGQPGDPKAKKKGDKRFKDEAWDNELFDYVKESYLLTSRWLQSTVAEVDGLDPKSKQKVDFYTRQFVEAMAPSNFLMTNPQVLKTTLETGGENLVHGLENLLNDLERGKGQLSISMTDEDAFEVGGNIATTPGKVIYQNDLMQLIQYSPTTEKVHKRPLLIIPPWINKYYILDLREKNSMVRWLVDQGFTVFMISWVNPTAELSQKSFGDYMLEGPFAAMEAIDQATGEKDVNVIGYCLGGTLLSATLAYLHAKPKGAAGPSVKRIKSATFFTTMTDFTEAGELSVFVDEEQIESMERTMAAKGFLDGREMATSFNLLRSSDLIWSFVINNYLLGKDPFPFDLLYWNSDSTRMPAAMHSFYLRNMYQNNLLTQPDALTLHDVPLDLRKIKTPIMMLSCREDHIAPWAATYALTQKTSGPTKFVLAASGHIAGVVNPPAAKKYSHWVNNDLPETPETWLETAEEHQGSWWPEWDSWVGKYAGAEVPARTPGDGKLPVLEEAPGSYVKVRSDD